MINRQNEQRCFRVKERSSILSNDLPSKGQNGEFMSQMTRNLFLVELKRLLKARDLIFSA